MSDATEKRAQTEAAVWFTRLSRVSVTTDMLRDFREWKQRDGNAAAYARIESMWNKALRLRTDPELQALTQATLEARPAGRRKRDAHGTKIATGAITATALAALGAWWLVQRPAEYHTGVGEQRLVVLADGSRIRLNTDSRIRVRLERTERRVELARGEAFFEVAHDPARPFLVRSDSARIRDVGTRFDVRRLDAGVKVTLVEGSVAVSRAAAGPATRLTPNQQVLVTTAGPLVPRAVDAAQASSWTTGRLVFHDVPLAEATAEVNRYARRKIVVDGPPGLGQRPISGVFQTGDTAAFVAGVSTLFALQTVRDADGTVHLKPEAPARPE